MFTAPPSVPLVDEIEGQCRLVELCTTITDVDDVGSCPVPLYDQLVAITKQLTVDGWELLGSGSYRYVYEHPNWPHVLKVPTPYSLVWGGVIGNLYEASAHEDYSMPIAPCELLWHESGVPLIVMERIILDGEVSCQERKIGRPFLLSQEVDRQQVGWSEQMGAWVAYDAGCPPQREDVDTPQWLTDAITAASSSIAA